MSRVIAAAFAATLVAAVVPTAASAGCYSCYATQQRAEMVAPARTYYVPVAPRCNNCGF